jgi:lipoate-protein ligase A
MNEPWRLLKLSGIAPRETQMVYEAVAIARDRQLVPDTIIFCWPKTPLVCIGFHQEVEKEIDYDYCQKNKIPVVRRILGGGAVYLDAGQLFYQVIASEENPIVPNTISNLFAKFLQAPIATYQTIGIPAEYKPINDIQVQGRKISGNGVGKVGKIYILTGNLILDFNYDEMVRILKVPSEKFRDKINKTLRDRISTIKRELGSVPDKFNLMNLLKENFEKILGVELRDSKLSKEETRLLRDLKKQYLSKDWLFQNTLRHPELTQKSQVLSETVRTVKIADGVFISESLFKSEGGLIRITMEIASGKIKDILISGDFEFFPKEDLKLLETALIGTSLDEKILKSKIEQFYRTYSIQAPGTNPQDFAQTIQSAAQMLE